MSDERDSADALGDGTEDDGRRDGTDAGRGAVVAPARPTGKRSRRVLEAPAEDSETGADADDAKDDDKAAKATKSKAKAKAKDKDGSGASWHRSSSFGRTSRRSSPNCARSFGRTASRW